MIPPKGAQTALARHPTETDTSVAATEPVLYVNMCWLNQIMFVLMYISVKKVECKNGKWTEVQDCGSSSCHGGTEGGAQC